MIKSCDKCGQGLFNHTQSGFCKICSNQVIKPQKYFRKTEKLGIEELLDN